MKEAFHQVAREDLFQVFDVAIPLTIEESQVDDTVQQRTAYSDN
jgi:hypothetical protein